MAFSINDSSSMTNFYANLNSQKTNDTIGNLASGLKLNKAADDSAAMAIANNFSAQVREAGQSIMNANDSIGMIQIADGAVSGISDNMDQIRDLTLRASSATMNSANRESIQQEINGLMQSSSDIASTASYNGMSLLDGSSNSLADVSGIVGSQIDVTSEDGLQNALESIDASRSSLDGMRSEFGSSQNQLIAEINNTSVLQVNAAASESNLRDIDFAQESANFNRQNLQTQIGSYAQAQSNAVAQNVMRLF